MLNSLFVAQRLNGEYGEETEAQHFAHDFPINSSEYHLNRFRKMNLGNGK